MSAPRHSPEDVAPLPASGTLVVPVIAEQLRISRRTVETGRATRVRKVVREQTREVDVPTWRDEVHVERVPVGRPVDAAIGVRHEGDTLVVPVVEERLVARTERVLREEIRITRRRRATHETRTVTLRHEVAIVECFDPATGAWVEIQSPASTESPRAADTPVPGPEASCEASAGYPIPPTTSNPRTTIMYTVIAAFDDRQAAQRSVDTLIARGIPRESIDLQSRSDTLDPVAPVTSPRGANDYSDVRRDGDDEGFLARVRHFFASLFGTDEDTQVGMYSEAIRRGSSIVTVDASDQGEADRAAQLMREQGGTIDLDERSTAWRAEGWGGDAPHAATGGTAGAMAAQALVDDDRIAPTAERNRERAVADARARTGDAARTAKREGDVVMPVVQEDVKIGKRAVQQGGVRVVRRVTETPVSELVRLREEHARVERRPVDREATRAERVEDKARRTDVDVDRLARQADDALGRATGDAHVGDDELGLPPGSRPPNQAPGRNLGDAPKDKGAGSRGRGARR